MEKDKKIGYLNKETNYNCDNCYYYHKQTIFSKTIFFKIPVTITGKQNKKYLEALYRIKISAINKNIKMLELSNLISGNAIWLYISRKKNDLYLEKKISFANITYQQKDSQGGVYDIPSSFICVQNSNQKINLKNYIDFDEISKYKKSKECFHCPTKYSIEQCLNIRKRKGKFNWKY